LAPRRIRGDAFRTLEGLLEAGQHCWREGDGFAGRHVGGQQRVQAPSGVARQPAAAGMAVAPQPVGHVLAGVGWPTGQAVEPLQAGLLMAVMSPLQALLKSIRMIRNRRYGGAHRLSSRSGSSLKCGRGAALCIIFSENSYYTAITT